MAKVGLSQGQHSIPSDLHCRLLCFKQGREEVSSPQQETAEQCFIPTDWENHPERNHCKLIWVRHVPHRLKHLNSWSTVGGAIWGEFRRCGLDRRNTSHWRLALGV